jgi:probable HAF family extracellular repeat protein
MKHCSLILVAIAACANPGFAAPLYKIVQILPPAGSGAYSVYASDINNRGEVVGAYHAYMPDGFRGRSGGLFHTDATGTVEFLVPGKRSTSIEGINDRGQFAISTSDDNGHWRMMYRYTPGIGMLELGNLGGEESEAFGINALGQITGFSQTPDRRSRVFRYTDSTGMENMSGTARGRGNAINDRGWIAGTREGSATLYRDGGYIDLGPGQAYGLNNAGDVVGQTFIPGVRTAFVYRNGQMKILGDERFFELYLFDINEKGQAVGLGYSSDFYGIHSAAIFWSEETGLIDLNTALPEGTGWVLGGAGKINDVGQIIGSGGVGAFRLDPIPQGLLARCIARFSKPSYSIVLISSPVSGNVAAGEMAYTLGQSINDAGQVAGDYTVIDLDYGFVTGGTFVYADRSGSRALPPPSRKAIALEGEKGINNSGQITVSARLGEIVQAYRYTPRIGYDHLGSFGGDTQARAINNLGQVTGFAIASDGQAHIFRYTDGIDLEDLGPGFGLAINDRGWVAGSSGGNAILFNGAGTVTLGPGEARGINNAGDAVGTGFVYLNGEMLILERPGPGLQGFGPLVLNDINGSREAVGSSATGDENQVALYWSEQTGLLDLNTLITNNPGLLAYATAINEAGQITGPGYRLDPLPNPAKALLPTLKAAAASLNRGEFHAALGQVAAFQNKVRAQIARDDPTQAEALVNCAQDVIDAIQVHLR